MDRKRQIVIRKLLEAAVVEARRGVRLGHGGPFGAVVADARGRVISRAHNTVLRDHDPSCHAEVNAIRLAAKKKRSPHLKDCLVAATSEPCPMCLATAYWAGVREITYCLPAAVAAGVGFSDAFIYREFARPPAKRSIKQWHFSGPVAGAGDLFSDWKKRRGRLY